MTFGLGIEDRHWDGATTEAMIQRVCSSVEMNKGCLKACCSHGEPSKVYRANCIENLSKVVQVVNYEDARVGL